MKTYKRKHVQFVAGKSRKFGSDGLHYLKEIVEKVILEPNFSEK